MVVETRLDDVGKDAADRVAKGVMVVGKEGSVGGFNHCECSPMFAATRLSQPAAVIKIRLARMTRS
jgi:hypothetical protein